MHLTLCGIALPPSMHSPAKRSRQSGVFEPKVRSLDVQSRLAQSRRQLQLKAAQSHVWGRAYVQVPVQSTFCVVSHEDLELPFGKVLDLLVLRAVFPFFPFRTARTSLESLPTENLLSHQRHGPLHYSVLGRRPDEELGRCLVLRAHRDLGIGRAGDVILEPFSSLQKLRQTLH